MAEPNEHLSRGASGHAVAALHKQLAALGYPIAVNERQGAHFGANTEQAVREFQKQQALEETGLADADTQRWLARNIQDSSYAIHGTVRSIESFAVEGLSVELADIFVGGHQVLAKTKVAASGSYGFDAVVIADRYLAEHCKTSPDLQVKVLSGRQLLTQSDVFYNASRAIKCNLTLPKGSPGLASEYETLLAALATVYRSAPASLQQASQDDIVYLAKKAARPVQAVALVQQAQQFSAPEGKPGTGIEPAFFYALFRAGVPTTPSGVYQTVPGKVEGIWRQAIRQNIIPHALSAKIPKAVELFVGLSAGHMSEAAPPIGVSTLREMVEAHLIDAGQQAEFVHLIAQYGNDTQGLWQAAEATLGAEVAAKLRFAGYLYALTLNNVPLVSALMKAEADPPLTGPLDLATRGYYALDKWLGLIADPIPSHIVGNGISKRRQAYAQHLAGQVRKRHPTAVIADKLRRKELQLGADDKVVDDTAAFLGRHQEHFEIGRHTINAYVAALPGEARPSAEVVSQIKRLHRCYQLTQQDAHIGVLLATKLDSAYAISRQSEASFVRRFAAPLGGDEAARALHRRAKQIHGAILNAAVRHIQGVTSPSIGRNYTAGIARSLAPAMPLAAPKAADGSTSAVLPTVTIENLFGSLDYCNCDDCSSILSPAAYLVDLLNFTDADQPTSGFQAPQSVLFGRRPDIQYLALECANTNTALPYIDIVNETLEYYVANNLTLDGFEGFNTDPSIASAELIANPQNVNEAAYAILQSATFPPPLPFNRSLVRLRAQLRSLGVVLPDAMIALRNSELLDNTVNPVSYGWTDILLEQVGFSREEHNLLVAPDNLAGLGDLYGLPNTTALATLQGLSLQDLSRRLGVSYDNIAAIVQTQFVNPNVSLLPKLQPLNVPFSTILSLSTKAISADEFNTVLPEDLDLTQYAPGTPADWVLDPSRFGDIMRIIVFLPTGPASLDPSQQCLGTAWKLGYTNPDPTANALSATAYIRLIRFLRLWQKLSTLFGVAADDSSIAQTDQILAALYPSDDIPIDSGDPVKDGNDRQLLDEGFTQLLQQLGFLIQISKLLGITPGQSLSQLLACWSSIGTFGPNSLYGQLFLTPARLLQDQETQTATLSGRFFPGETIVTTINGVALNQPVDAAHATPAAIAIQLAALINADDTDIDLASGLHINERFFASSANGTVAIQAGFTLDCGSTGPDGSFTKAPGGTPIRTIALVGAGALAVGTTLTTTINGWPIPYSVTEADLAAPTPVARAAAVAAAIADLVGSTSIPDVYSGLPINSMVGASSADDGSVTIIAVDAGAPFTLGCGILPVTGTYQAGSFDPGGTVTITCTAGSTATGTLTLAATLLSGQTYSIPISTPIGDAAAVALAVAVSLSQTLVGALVSSMDAVVTVNTVVLHGATVTASLTGGDGLAWTLTQPTLGSWVCTVGSSVSTDATLNTIINGITVTSSAAPGDDATTIAAGIAKDITNDPSVNTMVTAVAAGQTILVTEKVASADWLSVHCDLVVPGSITASGSTPPQFTLTIEGGLQPDDEINLSFNGATIKYVVQIHDLDQDALLGSDSAPWINSTNLIGFINSTPTIDPQSGQPISVAFYAAQDQTPNSTDIDIFVNIFSGYVPSVTASFDFGPNQPDNGNLVITGDPATRAVVVSQGIPAGTELTVTLDGVDLTYTVAQGGDAAAIGVAIADKINQSKVAIWIEQDGGYQFLSTLFSATSVYGTVTITSQTYGIAFTVSVGIASTGTYVSGRRRNPFVDDGYGNYLSDPTGVYTLFGYEPLICAGCNLTGAEFNEIATALGYDVLTPLKLEYVSALFRYGWLAHTLGISVVEFLALTSATELNPFDTIMPGTAAPVEPAAVRFVILLQAMAAAGLEPVQVLYLLWNQDLTGNAAPADSDILGLAFTLRADCAAVEAQFVVKSDPDGSIALALMTLVYGAKAANFFFGVLTTPPSDQVTASFFATYPELQIFFTEFSGQFAPVWRPALLAAILPVLKERRKRQQALSAISAAVGVDPSFATALLQDASVLHADADPTQPAIVDLTAVEAQGVCTQFFFDNVPKPLADLTIAAGPPFLFMPLQLLTLGGKPTSGDLLSTTMNGITVTYHVAAADISLEVLAENLAASLNGTTLTDGSSDLPLNQLFTAFAAGSTIVIVGADPTGAIPAPMIGTAVSAGGSETYVTTMPAGQIAVSWSGYLDVPQDGIYNLGIALDPGASVKVSLGVAELLGTQTSGTWRSSDSLSLTAGALSYFTVTATSVTTSVLAQWQSVGVGWQLIPGSFLYSDALVNQLRRSYVRFLKATSIATTLQLSGNEIAWLSDTQGASWLDRLADAPLPGDGAALTTILYVLMDYARVKKALAPGSDRLLTILQASPSVNTTVSLCVLTGWNISSVNSLLTRFFGNIDATPLTQVEGLARIFDAYALLKTCRVSAATLISTITNAPSAGAVSALQSALRAAYAAPDWQTVIQPINDMLRMQQRDALVTYILKRFADPGADPTTADIDTADRLFEYFLIDVQTQPAVQTSRIGLALSSVQLFIERVIRGLEPLATAADFFVDTAYGNTPLAQWTWMKRYRVWQANREIYLWPENWLYPELRDDASSLFQTMMGSLQQGDITDETASEAYLDYLTGLEEIGKLEICGLYKDGVVTSETLTVVGRSAGGSGKYFVRQYKGAGWDGTQTPQVGSWSPWTQVAIDCEDPPIVPVVWNNRLFLFWLKATKTGQSNMPNPPETIAGTSLGNLQLGALTTLAQTNMQAQTAGSVLVSAVLCWTEFYNGKWQAPKTSDPKNPTYIGAFDLSGTNSFDVARQTFSLRPGDYAVIDGNSDPSAPPLTLAIVNDTYPNENINSGFLLHNTHSLPIPLDYTSVNWLGSSTLDVEPEASIYNGGNLAPGTLSISYNYYNSPFQVNIISYTWQPRITLAPNTVEDDRVPFFYEDRKRVFFVQTAVVDIPVDDVAHPFGLLRTAMARSTSVATIKALDATSSIGRPRSATSSNAQEGVSQ